MAVDIFGRPGGQNEYNTQVVSSGLTTSEANTVYLRRDGFNIASADISMGMHKLTNVVDPTHDQDVATRKFVTDRISLPSKKFLAPYATDLNTYIWKDHQYIPEGMTEGEFDDLPAGLYACYTSYLPNSRLGDLPTLTKGYLISLTYQQPVDRNKYYKWIDSTNGEEWEAYFKQGTWNTWVKSSKVSKSGDTMTGDLALTSSGFNTSRNLGCQTITDGQTFNLWLGSNIVRLAYTDFLKYLQLVIDGGFQISNAGGILFNIGINPNPPNAATFYVPIHMGGRSIVSVADPTSPQDVATRNYVDNSVNDRAYLFVDRFPPVDMSSLTTPTPFVVTTNNGAASGWYAFAHIDSQDWLCSSPVGAWVQIAGDFKFVLKRLVLRGSFNGNTGTITSWNLSGTNDGGATFVVLANESSPGGGSLTLGTTRTILLPNNTTAFSAYRFTCTGGSGTVSINYIGLYNGISNFDVYGENTMQGNINMNSRHIVNLMDPTGSQDAATRNYVDNSVKRCHVGYVPRLTANVNYKGFTISASSEYSSSYAASYAFRSDYGSEWAVASGVTSNFWIKIACPTAVRTWKFGLRGRDTNERLYNWRIEGSTDNTNWVTLYTAPNPTYLGPYQEFLVDSVVKYQYYRLYCINAEGVTPGLSTMQMFVYDD